MFSFQTCGVPADAVSRIDVRRRRRSVVVTVLMQKPTVDGSQCQQTARVYTRKVGLDGRLGARSIKDGYDGRVRVKRPPAR